MERALVAISGMVIAAFVAFTLLSRLMWLAGP
jgi:hypothetical protein